MMKQIITFLIASMILISCGGTQEIYQNQRDIDNVPEDDIVRMESEAMEYEIIIIEPGFNRWLNTMAQPEGYYSQSFMESRNWILVQEWNRRVLQPERFDPDMYQLQIDYSPNINYGYELNYKLYNYFIYFQITYKQRLSSFVPRI